MSLKLNHPFKPFAGCTALAALAWQLGHEGP